MMQSCRSFREQERAIREAFYTYDSKTQQEIVSFLSSVYETCRHNMPKAI